MGLLRYGRRNKGSGGGNRKKVINEIKDYANAKEIKPPLFMFENGIFLIKERIIKWLNQI